VKKNRAASIDFGSNTIHLLVVEYDPTDPHQWKEIYRKRFMVGLASGGSGALILENPYQDCIKYTQIFKSIIDTYEVEHVSSVGTAIFRTARNSENLVNDLQVVLGSPIRVISGNEEAFLVAKGITAQGHYQSGTWNAIDIGGASTEFVLVANGEIHALESTSLGIHTLYAKFHKQDPLTKAGLISLEAYIREVISASPVLRSLPIGVGMIGVSGSFELLGRLLGKLEMHFTDVELDVEACLDAISKVQYLSESERANLPGIPSERAKLLVVGFTMVKVFFELMKPTSLWVTARTLKEGLIHEYLTAKYPK